MGAVADVLVPEIGSESVSTSQFPTDGSAIIIGAGNGIDAPGGLSVAGNMYVGAASDMGANDGTLVVLNTANSNPFTVLSGGNVSIGSMLQVLDGWNFGIKTTGTGWDVEIGSLDNKGIFKTENINTFISNGAISSSGDLSIIANDKVEIAGVTATGTGTTTLFGGVNGIESSGSLQNNAGQMDVTSGANITIDGSLENSGSGLFVSGKDVTVSGTMKNDAPNASINVNANSLAVDGGTESSYSFVNSGNANIVVTNGTTFAHGMNLNNMGADKVFNLVTGQLDLGSNDSLTSHQGQFAINVKNGSLNVGQVFNETVSDEFVANMDLQASGAINADSVINHGGLLTVSGGDVTVSQAITGVSGSVTNITASDTLKTTGTNVNAAISNAGDMTLNANNVQLGAVVNNGDSLTIKSLTDPTGLIAIGGDVSNENGNVLISAKDVSVDGTLINNSGTMNIVASDTDGGDVQVGAINALGGVVSMDALAGGASVSGALRVSGGVFNAGTSLRNLTVGGGANISGNFSASGNVTSSAGDMNVSGAGVPGFTMTADSIFVGGNVSLVADGVARNVTFDASDIQILKDVNVGNQTTFIMGTSSTESVSVWDKLYVAQAGMLESAANGIYVGNLDVDGLFVMRGSSIIANDEDAGIDIAGNLYFDAENDVDNPASGMMVRDTDVLTLQTQKSGANIVVGAVSVGSDKKLSLNSGANVSVAGVLDNNGNTTLQATKGVDVTGKITNTGVVSLSGATVSGADIENTGDVSVVAKSGDAQFNTLANSGVLSVQASNVISAVLIEQDDGKMDLNSATLSGQILNISGDGTVANINSLDVVFSDDITVAGDVIHGGNGGMLNFGGSSVTANNLSIGGDFGLISGNIVYNIGSDMTVNAISVSDAADVDFDVKGTVSGGALVNAGDLDLVVGNGIGLTSFENMSGVAHLDSGRGLLDVDDFAVNGGAVSLDGVGLYVAGNLVYDGILTQGDDTADLNIVASDYEITASKLDVTGIYQQGKLVVNSSDIDVGGDILASDLRFVAQKDMDGNTIWQNVVVNGDVLGAVDFIGLEKLTISNGDYFFDLSSQIDAAILPYAPGGMDATDINYWASVSLADNGTLGQIINPDGDDARALIKVDGLFVGGVEYNESAFTLDADVAALADGQIGITLRDAVDQGTAIWLLHADGGIQNYDTVKLLRNLNVRYCNANGSICYDYLTSLDDYNKSDDELPAYVSVRDSNNDGVSDDLYIVFDPRFGGPVLLNDLKLQPIVGRVENHTYGEYVSAGAIDDMITGRLNHTQFNGKTPIEVLPLVFKGTNLETMANELYLRMEDYAQTADGNVLARFSRLFQVHELEQIVGSITLNEHTTFRSFEDRMFDEFIWNRNRSLKKVWLDVDYGMFYQNMQTGTHSDGHRFSVMGGFDWQHSDTLVLGLTGRVSRTSSGAGDSVDLGYAGNKSVIGDVHSDVTNTDIAFGGYLMKILGEKSRMYANAFADIHFLDIERNQNFVSQIEGDGNAFSLTTEWGLMHDILNQYVVGNLYARAGYNFGFDITEKAGGADYMNMESDGYFMLTPGYSLVAQKRIYPSAWFQIRPYASVGVEYDLFGAPDNAKYKFAIADAWTKYDIDIEPLWANIGAGVEFLSANGVQVGLDYRYQYNDAIQLHNIKASLSYRF